ncbi:MAG TPA: hypothetical protein VJ501_01195 [Burkholderiaceae bacterium]|nr:hypothetical protein [Burkholderiaceae bacterium]
MTEGKLNELETACRVEADKDGTVRLRAGDVMELVNELRERRRHAADLRAHESAVANLQRLLASVCTYGEDSPAVGLDAAGRIAIQDPGR